MYFKGMIGAAVFVVGMTFVLFSQGALPLVVIGCIVMFVGAAIR